MKQLLVGMLNETSAHTQCMPKQLCMRLVMQRSVEGGRGEGCSTSLLIRMPLLCLWGLLFVTLPWYSAWICLISSFGSHLLSCPTMRECFHRSLREKNSRMAVQFEVSSIWVSFILKLASGLLGARTIKMM